MSEYLSCNFDDLEPAQFKVIQGQRSWKCLQLLLLLSQFDFPDVYRVRQREREEEQRKEEERIEAEEVRRVAAQFAEEERRKAEMRRQIAAKQAADNRHQIEDVALMKQIDRMQEEVVDFVIVL